MSDPFDPPEEGNHDDPPQEGPFPWDAEPPPEDPDAPRQRHDGFTEAKKSIFLKALVKTGCILDACRVTGFASRTVYRHQENDQAFFNNCAAALRMSGLPVVLTAWQRAVEGTEERFVAGGKVHVRTRYSDNLLRLLLQGSDPKKYGPRPGFKRKRLLKHEKKQMEREIRAELKAAEKKWSFDEAIEALDKKLEAFGAREDQKKRAAGWVEMEDGLWIPPGYAPIPGWEPPAGSGDDDDEAPEGGTGEGTPRDSM